VAAVVERNQKEQMKSKTLNGLGHRLLRCGALLGGVIALLQKLVAPAGNQGYAGLNIAFYKIVGMGTLFQKCQLAWISEPLNDFARIHQISMISAAKKSLRVCVYLVVDVPNIIGGTSEDNQRPHWSLIFFKQVLVGGIARLQCHPLIPELGVGASASADLQRSNRLSKTLLGLLFGYLLGAGAAAAERHGKNDRRN
jgi:hypothetical protein